METHRGQLYVEGARYGLEADISLDTRHLRVTTDDSVWTWPVREVRVSRWDGSRFRLELQDEILSFDAEDPISFTFEVVDALERIQTRRSPNKRRPAGRRTKSKALARRPSPPRVARPIADTQPTAVRHAAIWTDLASGREESALLDTLAVLAEDDEHHHTWAPATEGDDSVLVCLECQRVYVDISLEGADPEVDPR